MRAERLLSIILLLQVRGRITAESLATELGVSERTIYRDLDALSQAGVALYGDRGPGGGYALVDGYRTSLTGLTEAEASSLFMASLPQPLADLGLDQTVRAALLKLLAALPAGRRAQVQQEKAIIHLDAAPWFHTDEGVPCLTLLQQAARAGQKVWMRYQYPDGHESQRLISPYGLVAKATLWYVVAATPGGMRLYRVSRIQEARLTDETFERPADFDLAAYWAAACETFMANLPRYPVTLRVSPVLAAALPAIYGEHLRARLAAAAPDPDGWRVIVISYDDFQSACNEVMGRLGDAAEVLEPAELRAAIVDGAARLWARYAGATSALALPYQP
ncbi:MAG: YafY family transcriptional regulator [Anaerolineae bacterium]|nr:YafY family transcriptional regulator [Anaerolineae bacterium]